MYIRKWWLLCVVLLAAGGLPAQESEPPQAPENPISNAQSFDLGDQYFAIHLGAYFPLFNINPADGSVPATNQTIGGVGAAQWNIYLTSFLSVGLETSYIFAFSVNTRLLSLWPTAARVTFAPRVGIFLIPVWLDVGVNLSYYNNSTKADLLLRTGVGFYWFFEQSWGIGLRAQYWFIPQIYDGNIAPANNTRILNNLTTSIGIIYEL